MIWHENILAYLSLDIICSSKLTVFLELHPRKTVRLIFFYLAIVGYEMTITDSVHATNLVSFLSSRIISTFDISIF